MKSVLLYGAECWRTVETEINQLNAFHNRCLRRICNIYWPSKISNDDLFDKLNATVWQQKLKIEDIDG